MVDHDWLLVSTMVNHGIIHKILSPPAYKYHILQIPGKYFPYSEPAC